MPVGSGVYAEGTISGLTPRDAPTNSYRLVGEGGWPGPIDGAARPPEGFFASHAVCADNPEEALAFVAELQPDAVRDLRISEVKLVETVTEPKGIYSAGSYVFY